MASPIQSTTEDGEEKTEYLAALYAMEEPDRVKTIKQSITAFIQKLELSEKSFSTSLASKMFLEMQSNSQSSVDTVRKLRKVTENVPKSEARHIVYGRWYLNNLDYIRQLRLKFENRIYVPLKEFYSKLEKGNKSADVTKMTTPNLSQHSRSLTVLSFKEEMPEIKDLYDFTDLANISSRLEFIRLKWRLLISEEDEITPELFSINSQPVISANKQTRLDALLRLVPDILLKSRKAAMLASQWLDLVSRKVFSADAKLMKLDRVQTLLSSKLESLAEDIDAKEKELEEISSGIEQLIDREDRASFLLSSQQQLNEKIRSLETNIEKLQEEVSNLEQTDCEANDLRLKLRRISQLESELKIHKFNLAVISEDLEIELELKPNMVRITDQLQEQCEILEKTIDEKRTEHFRVESALVPIREDMSSAQEMIS